MMVVLSKSFDVGFRTLTFLIITVSIFACANAFAGNTGKKLPKLSSFKTHFQKDPVQVQRTRGRIIWDPVHNKFQHPKWDARSGLTSLTRTKKRRAYKVVHARHYRPKGMIASSDF